MDYFTNVLLIFKDLIKNGILLFGLGFLYTITNYNQKGNNVLRKIIFGILIGGIAILIMMFPWTFQPGVFFDTRSVLYSVIGLFFGHITTLVAAIVGIIYRSFVGGAGVYPGILTIITTSALGLFWRYFRKKSPGIGALLQYYLLGLSASIVTMLGFFLMPTMEMAINVIQQTVIPYLLLFPFVSVILARIIATQKERLLAIDKIKSQQILLQSSIDSTKTTEIYALDTTYCYLSFNRYHATQMKKHYGVDIQIGHSFLGAIGNEQMKIRIKKYLNRALSGETHTFVNEIEAQEGKYIEEQYSPIHDEHSKIIGITVFSQDISERKIYEQSIINLSYRDPLTNIPNRRFYNEELSRLDRNEFYPLSIISVDINGLKIINDAFGHDTGDALLCTVARDLTTVFRQVGKVARVGGDEFMILLANVDKNRALNYIEGAKNLIEKNEINGMNISVSFGLATKKSGDSVQEIIKIAEDNMYADKFYEISSHRNKVIKTILKTLYEKCPTEGKHAKRVALVSRKIGEALGLRNEEIVLLESISNLHDIGKIAMDYNILLKPTKLNQDEWTAVRKHPEIGYRILTASLEYIQIAEDVFAHHERYDGKGYPRRLKGEEIPLRSRILAVADAYEAMVSPRTYRPVLTHQQALKEIADNLGTQFDPKVGQAFIDTYKEVDHILE